MAARRSGWQRYVRIGGFLLVAVLFLPVLAIFLKLTLTRLPSRIGSMIPQPMPMMTSVSDVAVGGFGEDMRFSKEMAESTAMMAAPVRDIMPMPPVSTDIAYDVPNRMVVTNASLDLRAPSLAWTIDQIKSTVKNVGGFVENVNIFQPKNEIKTASLTVRVPADRLDATIADIKKTAASVVGENMGAADVTDQNVDLSARLKTRQAEEAALVSLLEKATKVSDVIEVTDRLAVVRSEIERLTTELQSLTGRVALATLAISITEDPHIVVDTDALRGGNVIKESMTDLAEWGIALGSALTAFIISGVPVLVIYGLFIWLFYRIGKAVARKVVGK